ncbi:MAG TPA: hypothetical protein VHA33_24075 [Candidatus Angelobacter sp.]|jgi:hypothetical protein|nr:hypothetical protein [Candidatus Angelobacter sp.]
MHLRNHFFVGFLFVAWLVPLTATGSDEIQRRTINCVRTPAICEIDIFGHTLSMGMSQDRAVELLKPYISEDPSWSVEHKPYSLWYVAEPKDAASFPGAIRAGVKFKAGKLDGAMVLWTPNSTDGADLVANLANLLERFSNEGSTKCTLTTTRNSQPQQEEREASFQCGLRRISITHTRYQGLIEGQKTFSQAEIIEALGNW